MFISGACLEVWAVPYLLGCLGYKTTIPVWFFTTLFLPLGLIGLYVSKFGNDRLVEWLLILPNPNRDI